MASHIIGTDDATSENLHDEIDWLGNSCVHNLFARNEVDMSLLTRAIEKFPHFLLLRNNTGRVPLHYAVDRGHPNQKAVELLIAACPDSIMIQDADGITPYDLVRTWEHSKPIQWLFLREVPDLDHELFLKLKYGPFGTLAVWASSVSAANIHSIKEGDNEMHDEDDLHAEPEEDEDEEDEEDSDRPQDSLQYSEILQNLSSEDHSRPSEDDRVMEFEAILHSGSVKTSHKTIPRLSIPSKVPNNNSSPPLPPVIQETPPTQKNRKFSVCSVHSFDDSDAE
jgi:hypothetical protein